MTDEFMKHVEQSIYCVSYKPYPTAKKKRVIWFKKSDKPKILALTFKRQENKNVTMEAMLEGFNSFIRVTSYSYDDCIFALKKKGYPCITTYQSQQTDNYKYLTLAEISEIL